jgi:kynureninase
MTTLDDARALDASDPIAWLRDAFVIADDDQLCADGNSLGRLSNATREAIDRAVADEWGRGLVRSWDRWIDLPVSVGDAIGAGFLGAAAGQTVVADSTTVNLYKLAAAALRQAPHATPMVLTDAANFPTDRYVLEGLVGADRLDLLDGVTVDSVDGALDRRGGQIALASFSAVDYRSGTLLDVGGITAAAHRHGALVLWDLSHAVGAVELELDACDVDMAVGCTYKYLNGGPGAPAFLYVAARLHDRLQPVVQGWFGAADQFAMHPRFAPAPGVRRYLAGTPPVVALRGLEAAVATLGAAGITALAAKGRTLTDVVIAAAHDHLTRHGFDLVSPRDASARGAHIALRHDDAWRICQALIAYASVVPDFREPDVVRLGFAPAYTRHVDAYDAVVRIARVVEGGLHEAMPAERARVT